MKQAEEVLRYAENTAMTKRIRALRFMKFRTAQPQKL